MRDPLRGAGLVAVLTLVVPSRAESAYDSGPATSPPLATEVVPAEPANGGQDQAPTDRAPSAPGEPPTHAQCLDAHRNAQTLQQERRLVEARDQTAICTSAPCPGLVVKDCARWLAELDQRTPSVVFEVSLDHRALPDARISVNGQRIEPGKRGEALRLNPGKYTFRVVLPGHPPRMETVVLAEGMRFRTVSFRFETPRSRPVSPPSAPALDRRVTPAVPTDVKRPVPVVFYPLVGLGVVGAAGFVGWGLAARSEQKRLERTCSPDCTDSDLRTMRTRYLIGDVALGVGAAALFGATIVYVTRPKQTDTVSMNLEPLPGGLAATIRVDRF